MHCDASLQPLTDIHSGRAVIIIMPSVWGSTRYLHGLASALAQQYNVYALFPGTLPIENTCILEQAAMYHLAIETSKICFDILLGLSFGSLLAKEISTLSTHPHALVLFDPPPVREPPTRVPSAPDLAKLLLGFLTYFHGPLSGAMLRAAGSEVFALATATTSAVTRDTDTDEAILSTLREHIRNIRCARCNLEQWQTYKWKSNTESQKNEIRTVIFFTEERHEFFKGLLDRNIQDVIDIANNVNYHVMSGRHLDALSDIMQGRCGVFNDVLKHELVQQN